MAMDGYSDEKQKSFINVCRSMEDYMDKSLEIVINNKELKELMSRHDKLIWDINELGFKEEEKSADELKELKELEVKLSEMEIDLRDLRGKKREMDISLVLGEEAIEKAAESYRALVGDGPTPVIKIRHRLHVRAAAYLDKVPRARGDWVFSDEVWRSEPHAKSMMESAEELEVDWRPIPRHVIIPTDLPAIGDTTLALPAPGALLTSPASDPGPTLLLPADRPDLEWEPYLGEEE